MECWGGECALTSARDEGIACDFHVAALGCGEMDEIPCNKGKWERGELKTFL